MTAVPQHTANQGADNTDHRALNHEDGHDLPWRGTDGSADARAQLQQNRLDAAMQGSETIPYLMSLDKGKYKPVGLAISKQFTGLGIEKSNTELVTAISEALQGMIDDGTYGKILKKWDLEQGAVEKISINAGQ